MSRQRIKGTTLLILGRGPCPAVGHKNGLLMKMIMMNEFSLSDTRLKTNKEKEIKILNKYQMNRKKITILCELYKWVRSFDQMCSHHPQILVDLDESNSVRNKQEVYYKHSRGR